MAQNVIVLKNINYVLNKNYILEDITISIKENDFLAIIGPNGGGKSTLLQIILGLIKPTSGYVEVLGESPEKSRNFVGYLPQHTHFETDFPINVFETVLMGRYKDVFKGYNENDKKIVLKWLENLDIHHLKDRQIERLSGGQMQRVFLARALAREPKILLLDEPTSSIDPKTQNSFYDLLQDIREKMAVVLVSHDVGVVSSYVDNIACLNRRLYSHGSIEESIKGLEKAYQCPIDLIAHGIPHRVLREH
ncbi:metal ABC transporter ATP-binding protein [Methanobacterium alcaliphilum]|uniref:metal ABC transporter ATP-binding protein n=1 Tax=Methanobacterium alcaliphilum TaxID=392018 RepID=UPI00200A50B6|nr:metal ABC transporter ATP-binding protein [Methanobacterium alcaliphilum]MCK9152470.1 metal ABC transporter ATP-binding protein [Methanobacterium alcaliphilum]